MIGNFSVIVDHLMRFSNHPITPSSRLAVALSGGSDSMALTLLAKQAGCQLVALTIDHQLRPESAAEAAQVATWMAARDIEHHILRWEHGNITGNLQAAARAARYRLLTDYCCKNEIRFLLVGHTEDDQVETIAYRQERAAGAVGLAGMSAMVEKNGVTLLRPLLATTRQALREYLAGRQQAWIDDPSNENPAFARIRIRRELAKNPTRKQELLQLGQTMAAERKRVEQRFADFVARVVTVERNIVFISPQEWRKLTNEDACYALSQMLTAVSGRPYPPRYTELQCLQQRMHDPVGKATLGKCVIQWNAKRMAISPEGLATAGHPHHIALVTPPFYSIERAPKESSHRES